MPALLMRMSSRSHSWRTASARRRTSASEEKSAGKKAAEPRLAARIWLSNCSPRVRSRPWIRTRAPRSASRRATSRPTPSVDPVTSTVLFAMFMLPKTAKIWFGFGHESRDHSALSCSRLLRSGIEPRPCGAAAGTRGSGLPGRDARAMARRAGRAAYAIDVSACFPALVVGRVLAVADAQSRGLEHFAPPRHRRRLRRSYRARRLVGQGAAAAGGRSAKVAQDGLVITCYFVDDANSPFSLHRQLLPQSLCRRAFQPPCAPRGIELGGKLARACHRVRGKQCWFALTIRGGSSRETRPCCQGRRAIAATMRCGRSPISR